MTPLSEAAPAKVNLTLAVRGRRLDGYHELHSIVAFAGCGDILTLQPGADFALDCDGPFRSAIDAENLVAKAMHRVASVAPGLVTGTFRLTKNLPVAAGLGGGSADAAAALRLLRRANPGLAATIDWPAIAASIGADVTVCLESLAALMTGIGERVTPLERLPKAHIVLANPGVPLRTVDVFRALEAGPVPENLQPPELPRPRDIAALIGLLEAGTNDLEAAAIVLCPVVGTVLARLTALPGARLARMSGSGPTCFAIFEHASEAYAAATALAAAHPSWWVQDAALS